MACGDGVFESHTLLWPERHQINSGCMISRCEQQHLLLAWDDAQFAHANQLRSLDRPNEQQCLLLPWDDGRSARGREHTLPIRRPHLVPRRAYMSRTATARAAVRRQTR
eukprot:TRINITY_DN1487_c4_g1_i1.p1 TRINITY_DN1487_c4_g1~~TRINITY_DN1487_c4_g1_i1.p1  ORF type:complete len:109 (-),score=8.49 TRINITY_DN1487_c4_g1_i1:57-383(-)